MNPWSLGARVIYTTPHGQKLVGIVIKVAGNRITIEMYDGMRRTVNATSPRLEAL